LGQQIGPIFKGQEVFLTFEDGTDTLYRNISEGLPLNTALYPRSMQFSSALQWKPEVTDRMLPLPKGGERYILHM
jgi:hypothetical protein